MGREQQCKHISLACVGRAHSVWATPCLPPLTACVLSWCTLLRLQAALQGNCLNQALGCMRFPGLSRSGSGPRVLHRGMGLVGPAFCALPRSEQLRRPGAWQGHSPKCMVHLITSPVPATWFPGCAVGALSHGCRVPPLGSSSFTAALLADVNHPGSQEDLLRNWEPAHSLVEDAISGTEIAPRLPALAGAHLPLCLWQGEGLVSSWLALLWYSFNRFFCEQARLCLRAFRGKVLSFSLSFFFFLWLSHSLDCYLRLAPSDCPQGIQAWPPPYACSPRLPVQPLLTAGG